MELREGWPRDRAPAQRLPFDEDQWRRKFLKSIIGHLGKAQNARRVIKLTEHAMDGTRLPSLNSPTLSLEYRDPRHSHFQRQAYMAMYTRAYP